MVYDGFISAVEVSGFPSRVLQNFCRVQTRLHGLRWLISAVEVLRSGPWVYGQSQSGLGNLWASGPA